MRPRLNSGTLGGPNSKAHAVTKDDFYRGKSLVRIEWWLDSSRLPETVAWAPSCLSSGVMCVGLNHRILIGCAFQHATGAPQP
jgi:hypothetical protein